MTLHCPHCGRPAELVTGAVLYRRPDLAHKNFWRCSPCGAHVGCHDARPGFGDGTVPLGRLANAALRAMRNEAHAVFDPIWQRGGIHRTEAYSWLAAALGIPVADCHIAMFDEQQCGAVINAVRMRSAGPNHAGPLTIFSDGSVYPNPGNGGWAFVAYDRTGAVIHEAYGGERETTNNRMEMLAIIKALKWAKDQPCEIHSDSELCVNTLTKWAATWQKRGWAKSDGKAPLNLDLVRLAYPLYLNSKARIKWVRGHNGTEGNERADVLAAQGRATVTEPSTTTTESTP